MALLEVSLRLIRELLELVSARRWVTHLPLLEVLLRLWLFLQVLGRCLDSEACLQYMYQALRHRWRRDRLREVIQEEWLQLWHTWLQGLHWGWEDPTCCSRSSVGPVVL